VREGMPEGLPFHLADYLELVNWTDRPGGARRQARRHRREPAADLVAEGSRKRPGRNWPGSSRPNSATGSDKPSTSSRPASEGVRAGRAAFVLVGGCFQADGFPPPS